MQIIAIVRKEIARTIAIVKMVFNYRCKLLYFIASFILAGEFSSLAELIRGMPQTFYDRMDFLRAHDEAIQRMAEVDMGPDNTFKNVLEIIKPNNKQLLCLHPDRQYEENPGEKDALDPEAPAKKEPKFAVLEGKKKEKLADLFKYNAQDWADFFLNEYGEYIGFINLLKKGKAGMFACKSVLEEVLNGNEAVLDLIFFAWCLRDANLLPDYIKSGPDFDFIKRRVEKVRWFNLFNPQITGRLAYHLATAWDHIGGLVIVGVPTLLIVGMVYWNWSLWWISLVVLFNPVMRFWLMFPKFCMGWDLGECLIVKFLAMLLSKEIKYKDDQCRFSAKINAGPAANRNLCLLDAWSSGDTSRLMKPKAFRDACDNFIKEINENHKKDRNYNSYDAKQDREDPIVLRCILQAIKAICKDASPYDLNDPESEKAKIILDKLKKYNINVGQEHDPHSQLRTVKMALYFTRIIEGPRFGILSYIPLVSHTLHYLMTLRVCKYCIFLNLGWWVFNERWRFSGCSLGRCITGWNMFCLFELTRKELEKKFECFST